MDTHLLYCSFCHFFFLSFQGFAAVRVTAMPMAEAASGLSGWYLRSVKLLRFLDRPNRPCYSKGKNSHCKAAAYCTGERIHQYVQ